MGRQGHLARAPLLAAAIAIAALIAPLSASATTGTGVTRVFRVTVTDRGVAWKPALRTLDPIVGGRLRVTVVNSAAGPHWFRVGTRQTKVLKQGGSARFFYTFVKLGKVPWRAGVGSVGGVGFHGVIHVQLPGHFG